MLDNSKLLHIPFLFNLEVSMSYIPEKCNNEPRKITSKYQEIITYAILLHISCLYICNKNCYTLVNLIKIKIDLLIAN